MKKFLYMMCTLAMLHFSSVAHAVVKISVQEVSGNVEVVTSGSADTSDLFLAFEQSLLRGGYLNPGIDRFELLVGGTGLFGTYLIDNAAESPFSSALPSFSSDGGAADPGSAVGILADRTQPFSTLLFLPQGYISNQPISFSSVYSSQTLKSLGFIPGTYTYTWGSANPDSLVIEVMSRPSTPVPALSVWAIWILAIAAAVFGIYRLPRHI